MLRLLEGGEEIIGLDNLNSYDDPALKQALLARIETAGGRWKFAQRDLEDRSAIAALFADCKPRAVVHLAAQAGGRYSIENPAAHIQSNLDGIGTCSRGAATRA